VSYGAPSMVVLSHSVADFIWGSATVLSVLVAVLAAFLFSRRIIQAIALRHSLKLGAQFGPCIEALLDGSANYETGLLQLRKHPGNARRAVVDQVALAEAHADPDRVATLRKLCTDLGLVAEWRRQLSRERSGGLIFHLTKRGLALIERIPSLSFVARAEAAERLGLVGDRPSWPLLARALNDPNLAVRSVAARALGRIHAPASFPMLMRKLEDAVLGGDRNVSLRSLKMTLASFPLTYLADLSTMLQHPHRRVRFLAADLAATMMQRSRDQVRPWYLPHDPLLDAIADIFLTGLITDQNPDVRARSADVIAHLDDDRAVSALLVLLEDGEWFVRLHATRALAECEFVPLEQLGGRLTDPNWRVREAAAQALSAQGQHGVRFLLSHFRTTNDRYSREQVAEHIERLGLIPSLVAAFGDPSAHAETRFIEGLVRLGRTASLRAALGNAPEYKRTEVLAELRKHSDLTSLGPLRSATASTGSPAVQTSREGRPHSVS